MKKADVKTLNEIILDTTDNIFLYIGGHHFSQKNLDAEEVVKEIDSSATCYWVWMETEFDNPDAPLGQEPYRQGPMLIQLHNIGSPSPLIEHFFTVWGYEQKGVLLTSAYSGDELSEYLQSLLWMQGENEEAERYSVNLQNPDFQSSWLKSYTAEQLQEFLGPISSINWLEICGYEMQWYSQLNKQPILKRHNVGWFEFSNEQISRFKKLETIFLRQELISHINHTHPNVEASLVEGKANDVLKQAQAKGIDDFESTLLALKAQLFIKNKEESEKTINLLADKGMPLDIRVQLAEQKINQAQQLLTT